MDLAFTPKPGRRERHLRRQYKNPLFTWPLQEVTPEKLLAAQQADYEELQSFHGRLHELVTQAAQLPAQADTKTVLQLKEALEAHYEQACGLAEDQTAAKAAIERLIEVVMKVMWRAAGDDPLARQELSDEERARAHHFQLIEHPLVVDLLHPESLILPAELIPTLLSASDAEVRAACELFNAEELALLIEQGREQLAQLERSGQSIDTAEQRLEVLCERLEQFAPNTLLGI